MTNYKLSFNPNASNFEAMYFDFHNPILGTDASVRKAIAMAIDHQALMTTARHGEAQPLCTDHGSAFNPGYEANAPCPKFDAAAANTLLDSDGWAKGSDGVRAKGRQWWAMLVYLLSSELIGYTDYIRKLTHRIRTKEIWCFS